MWKCPWGYCEVILGIARSMIGDVLTHGFSYFGMLSCLQVCGPEMYNPNDTELLNDVTEIDGRQSSQEEAA